MLFRNKKRYVVHTMGDPVLREVARPVGAVTPELRQLADRMMAEMSIRNPTNRKRKNMKAPTSMKARITISPSNPQLAKQKKLLPDLTTWR